MLVSMRRRKETGIVFERLGVVVMNEEKFEKLEAT